MITGGSWIINRKQSTPFYEGTGPGISPVLGFPPPVSDCDDKSLIRFLLHKKLLCFRQSLTHIRISP